jgi:anti-sigma regulatory factor (Ser/Thr protein kinase)
MKNKLKHYEEIQTLIKGVKHDIQSPLAAIRSLSQSTEDVSTQSLMSHIIKRMEMIIKDLEFKSHTVEIIDHSSLPVIKMLNLIIGEKLKHKADGAMLIFNKLENEVWINGSYSEFLRVLSNIINNAIEASSSNSKINISSFLVNENMVEIKIEDCGKGIPKQNLEKLFMQGATFDKKGGTGFGLYNAKRIINEMKGDIRIESTVGVGTTVSIVLPRIKNPQWAIDKINLTCIKQLVVIDDEEIYKRIWQNKLSKSSMEVLYYNHPSIFPPQFNNNSSIIILDNTFFNEHGFGLSYLESHKLENCILVTSDWALKEVQNAVSKLNISMFGKEFIDGMEVIF